MDAKRTPKHLKTSQQIIIFFVFFFIELFFGKRFPSGCRCLVHVNHLDMSPRAPKAHQPLGHSRRKPPTPFHFPSFLSRSRLASLSLSYRFSPIHMKAPPLSPSPMLTLLQAGAARATICCKHRQRCCAGGRINMLSGVGGE